MGELLIWNNATVTVCHTRTSDLPSIVREADIVVVAARQPKLVKGSWIKPGSAIIYSCLIVLCCVCLCRCYCY